MSWDEEDENNIGLTKAASSFLEDIKSYEKLLNDATTTSEIEQLICALQPFQAEPQFLDPILESLINTCLKGYIEWKKTWPFQIIYNLCKIRGAKVVTQFFPSKVSYLEDVLDVLELKFKENTSNFELNSSIENSKEVDELHLFIKKDWQARYVLLLWLSILVLAPFNLDSFGDDMKDRLYTTAEKYLFVSGKERDAAALVMARLCNREDCKTSLIPRFLQGFTNWDSHTGLLHKIGMLQCSAVLVGLLSSQDCEKYYTRYIDHMLSFAPENSIYQKLLSKNLGRIALAFLRPSIEDTTTEILNELPEQVEQILGELLSMTGHKDTLVRYAVAKAIARIVQNLPDKTLQQQVIDALLDVLNENIIKDGTGKKILDQVSHFSWQGIMLCIAELLRRHILDSNNLSQLLPYLRQGLRFEQKQLTYAVGSNVRDAACYVCWSLFRTYKDTEKQFIRPIFQDLVSLSCLDREVNIRRAASAALQEGIGRLGGDGSVEHGLKLIQKLDYFKLGLRRRAYLEVAVDLYENMGYKMLLDDTIQFKVTSWDPVLRRLAGKLVARLVSDCINDSALNLLLSLYSKSDMDVKHGITCTVAELLFTDIKGKDQDLFYLIDNITEYDLQENEEILHAEMLLTCVKCIFNNYYKLSEESKERLSALRAKINISMELYNDSINDLARDVAGLLPKGYFDLKMRDHWISRMKANKGCFAFAFGKVKELDHVALESLLLVAGATVGMTDIEITTKAKAIESLSLVIASGRDLDHSFVISSIHAILEGLNDYTIDTRGDVGFWVRKQAIESSIILAKREFLTKDMQKLLISGLIRMSVEPLDRLRSKSIATIVGLRPLELEQLLKYIKEDDDKETYFEQMFHILEFQVDESYISEFVIGLVLSVGAQQASEFTLKESLKALTNYLQRSSVEDQKRFLTKIIDLIDLKNQSLRLACAALKTIAELLSSGYSFESNSDFHVLINRLYVRTYNCHINTRSLNRILPAIQIFSNLIESNEHKDSLRRLVILCKHRFPSVRISASENLYLALMNRYSDREWATEMMEILEDKDWSIIPSVEMNEIVEKLASLVQNNVS